MSIEPAWSRNRITQGRLNHRAALRNSEIVVPSLLGYSQIRRLVLPLGLKLLNLLQQVPHDG